MDVLTEVLDALELKGCISARRALLPPWRYNFVASQDMIFHLLSSGGGYLSIDGEPTPLRIEDGGVLLFPFGHAHSICDERFGSAVDRPRKIHDSSRRDGSWA